MIILSAHDLEHHGIRQTASTITYMGKAFVRGQTFTHRLRKLALEAAEESLKRGHPCFLVDFETHITLWREQQQQRRQQQAQRLSNPSVTPPATPTSAQASPTTTELTYRGRVVKPFEPVLKSPRPEYIGERSMMYRGRPINVPIIASESDEEIDFEFEEE